MLANLSLARRLERAEAVMNARFVEARARLMPESDAEWIEVAGAYAMYDGVRSPCTQTFGLGLFQMPTAAEGWRELTEFADLMLELMRISAATENRALFFAELEGHPIAAGALGVHDGVALFAGASTVPEWRRRGAQQVLFETRCRYALDAGCDLAMVCAEPGSSSQRNAERHGFRIVYTRIKWALQP